MVDDDAQRSIARMDYDALIAEAGERTKHQILLVDRGLQGLMLINGGALIALFTLLGSAARLHLVPGYLWGAFASFALGFVFAMLANLGAYLSQGFYYQASQFQAWDAQQAMNGLPRTRAEQVATVFKHGQNAEFGGVAAAVLALLAFIIGCALALLGVLPG